MNIRKIELIGLTLLTGAALNAAQTNAVQKAAMSMEEEEGGLVVKPGTAQGKIVFVNAQTRMQTDWMQQVIDRFNACWSNWKCYTFDIQPGTFAFPSPKCVGEATLFIIDDPAMPAVLSAPDNRWAMVNVHDLDSGRGQKPAFFKARTMKRLMRGLSLLAGAQDSTYPRCLLTSKTKPEDLDLNPDCRLPVDVIRRFERYLLGFGIKPARLFVYSDACEQGWAPKPTNDLQRAIWDQVHALPKNPIKILPETKPVKK